MAFAGSDWLRHFRLFLWKPFDETWQEARSRRPLPSLCFSGRSEKQDGRPVSDWLRHFRLLLWNRWSEFNGTWQEARSQCPLPSLCFSGRSEKQDDRSGLWFAETCSTSPLKPLIRIHRNLTGSKISTFSTKFVGLGFFFFFADWNNKMAAQPLIGWNFLVFSSETAEHNFKETWQEAKSQRPLPSLCFSGY